MGLFDFLTRKLNGKNERLLQWQNAIMTDSPNRLIMTEEQLKAATIQQANNDLRIINDSASLVEKTTKPDVFFSRLNLLIEKSKHLASLEKYISFSGAPPTAAYNEALQNYNESIRLFLIQYFSETFDKAEAMKTEKGRIGKYQKFYDSLQIYYQYMTEEHIRYIETKYKAYTGK
jgi:hypothetical protein